MSWAFLDDRANENEKLQAVGGAAAWYWACGLMYCRRRETERRRRGERDDFIPSTQALVLFPDPKAKAHVKALVTAKLWHATEGGYLVNDYRKVYGSGQPIPPADASQPEPAGTNPAGDQPTPARLGGLARAAGASRGPAGTFQPTPARLDQPNQPRARQDPDPTPEDPKENNHNQDLSGVRARSVGSGGGDSDLLIGCPADLELNEGQKAQQRMHMMVSWADHAIAVLTAAFVGNHLADENDKRTLIAWRKCLSRAVTAGWNNPSKRPSEPVKAAAPAGDETGGYGSVESWG